MSTSIKRFLKCDRCGHLLGQFKEVEEQFGKRGVMVEDHTIGWQRIVAKNDGLGLEGLFHSIIVGSAQKTSRIDNVGSGAKVIYLRSPLWLNRQKNDIKLWVYVHVAMLVMVIVRNVGVA